MSIKIMSRVWADSKQAEGALLVALALADFSDDDGFCWPSVPTIARKARLSDSQVQRCIKKMIEDGEIEKEPSQGFQKDGGRRSNTYHFLDGSQNATGRTDATHGVAPMRPPLYIDGTVSESPLQPPVDPPAVGEEKIPESKLNSIVDFLMTLDGIRFTERRPSDWGRVRKLAKGIFASTPDATIEECKRRAANYDKKWPGTITAAALVKHWPSLGSVPQKSTSASDGIINYSHVQPL